MTESPQTIIDQRVDYAQRRRVRAAERRTARSVWLSPPLMALVAVGVVVLLGAGEAALTFGRIHPGVTVSGIELGGMIPEKARRVLETELAAASGKPVTVTYRSHTWPVTAKEVGLTFDHDAIVSEAMGVGRSGGPLSSLGARIGAWFGQAKLEAQRHARGTRLDSVLDRIAAGTDIAPVDARVDIDDTTASVVPGKSGLGLDRAAASRLILAAMLAQNRMVRAPVDVAPVAIDGSEAESACALVRQMLSGPVTITFKDRDWVFKPDQIARWISFERSDVASAAGVVTSTSADVTLRTFVAAAKTGPAVIKAVGGKVGHPAKNAHFRTSNGSVTIIPSRNGVGPDIDVLAAKLTDVLTDPLSQRTVELRTMITRPKITTEDARNMGIKQRISVYTTTYSPGNRPRVNNIHQLGDALDGTLIPPGDTFSFNKSVGERTAAKGYQEAPAIVNGKLVPQLGGGICQVGTTIFNTVFESGFPVVERRNHSFYISHYPKGRDATVSWGGPDFKFKNDSEHWVLVSVSYSPSSITIALYGTDPGYEVDAHTSAWRNVRPFPVEEIKDKTIVKGSKTIEDPGVDGKSVTVERTVTKDGKVVRTDTFVSVYKPKTQVVRVGTKPKVPSSQTDTQTSTP